MIDSQRVVSIHPYFKVKPGQEEAARALRPQFIARTATETKNLYYDFTLAGDRVFCREAYEGADGLLAHLENVGSLLEEFVRLAEVLRVEVHGAADELDKLREPLAHLNPDWFVFECGVKR
jgi:quinol monooxygenase YgiN